MSALAHTTAEADAVGWELRCGDALQLLAGLEPRTIDAIVCDPPYGLDLIGTGWDGVAIRESAALHTGRQLDPAHAFTAWVHTWARHALQALKPGGWLLAFGGTRTSHRLAAGLEDAGFQLRDSLCWLHRAGVPKSRRLPGGRATTLRPGWEPIILARRPLATVTTIENVAAHGTGALNIDACRIEGRYPANVAAAHAEDCDETQCAADCPLLAIDQTHTGPPGEGQRLFFIAKADRAERDAGCEQLPAGRPQMRFTRQTVQPRAVSASQSGRATLSLSSLACEMKRSCWASFMRSRPYRANQNAVEGDRPDRARLVPAPGTRWCSPCHRQRPETTKPPW